MPNKHFCQGPMCHERITQDRFLKSRGVIRGRYALFTMDADNYCERGKYFCSCLLYTSPSPRDRTRSRMPSSA